MKTAKKQFGQHFLINSHISKFMAEKIPNDMGCVIEIGPGMGALTKEILSLDRVKKLILLEKDPDMASYIANNFADPRISLQCADATKIDIGSLSPEKSCLVANLPYNVGATIVLNIMENIGSLSMILTMLQKEVVQRIIAKPSTKNYGKISILMQIMCDVESVMTISPNNFNPKPKVESMILSAIPKKEIPSQSEYLMMQKLCTVGFGQRRKTLLNGIKADSKIYDILHGKIDPFLRIDSLSPVEVLNLARIALAGK